MSSLALRPLRVFFSLLPFIISFLRDYRRWVIFGPPRRLTRSGHQRRARRLTNAMARLGPAFIKGVQVMATREDILPEDYTREFKRLQDNVPSFPSGEAKAIIRESLGKPVGQLFERFDERPLAAASLGQVHRARHQEREIVIKVLRPNVRAVVESDLRVVAFLLSAFSFFVDNYFVASMHSIYAEFKRIIGLEMDFRNEERHAAILRANVASDPRVLVPECISSLTTMRTVAFDFIEGHRVDDPRAFEGHDVAPRQLLDTLIEVYLRMAVVHGFIHADPHPGNLLVDRQGRLVILDYGMALEFSERTREMLLRGCFAMVRKDVETLVDCFYHLRMVDPQANRAQVAEAAEALLSIQLREDFNPRMIQEILDDVLQTFHRFPIRMPQQLVYLFRATALVEGIGHMYDPYFSSIREATPILKRMTREMLLNERKSLKQRAKEELHSWVAAGRQARRVLQRMEREEQRLHLHPDDHREIAGYFMGLMQRQLIGVALLGGIGFGLLWSLKIESVVPAILIGLPLGFLFLVVILLPRRPKRHWSENRPDALLTAQVERFQDRVKKAAPGAPAGPSRRRSRRPPGGGPFQSPEIR